MRDVVPASMRAARLHAVPTETGGPPDLRLAEVPVPSPGPGEVLVRVRACGVCLSDVHVASGELPVPTLPLTLGHEVAGDVATLGDDVPDWQPGDRVIVQPGLPCHRCPYCRGGRENLCRTGQRLGLTRDGGQAEYVAVDHRALVPVSRQVPPEQAAILADAVATPYHAMKRAGITEGTTVAVVGLGGLGLHAVQLCRLAGAGTIVGVDVDPVSLERGLAWGADEVVDAREGHTARRVRELTEGGVERSLEFVGTNATVDQTIKMLAPGGRAVVVGITVEELRTLPSSLLVANELEVVGSVGSTTQDLHELVDLLEGGRLDLSRSVTHRHPLARFPDALVQLADRRDDPIRIVIEP